MRRGGRGATLQRSFGAVMVLTAVLMFTSVDLRFQEALASHFPSFLTNPTGGLEKTDAVEEQLAELRGEAKFRSPDRDHGPRRPAATPRCPASRRRSCRCSARRRTSTATPALVQHHAADDGGLRGRVVLIDFWTYTCINCIRTLPYLKAWDARYRDQGLTIVGVHTPEFAFERKDSNVARRDRPPGPALPRRAGQRVRRPGTRSATRPGPRST